MSSEAKQLIVAIIISAAFAGGVYFGTQIGGTCKCTGATHDRQPSPNPNGSRPIGSPVGNAR